MNLENNQDISRSLTKNSLRRSPTSGRTLFGFLMTGLTFLAAALALLPLVAVLSYVLFKGLARLSWSALTELPPAALQQGGGFGNALFGTIIMVGIGALISIPVGIMAAVYLSEFSAETKLAQWLRFATNVLSGVPSIIVGVFGYGVAVLGLRKLGIDVSFSAIAGGFALSVLMLPIIVRATEESLKLIPQEIRQASLGLGATKFQTVFRVILPAALPAIMTGITLAIARAAGETAPLLFTAQFSQYYTPFTEKGLSALFEPTASLAVLVYNFATRPYPNQQELAWAASLILVLLVLLTSVASRIATSRRVY